MVGGKHVKNVSQGFPVTGMAEQNSNKDLKIIFVGD